MDDLAFEQAATRDIDVFLSLERRAADPKNLGST